jgi:hypothetical protein
MEIPFMILGALVSLLNFYLVISKEPFGTASTIPRR